MDNFFMKLNLQNLTPHGKRTMKRYLTNEIECSNEELVVINEHIKDTQYFIDTQCARETPMFWWKESFIEFMLIPRKEGLEKYIKACEFKLASLGPHKPSAGTGVSAVEIARAKEYPIGDILDTKKTMIKCPLHNDKNASLKIYPDNRWFCFSCNIGGDVIDLMQKMQNIDFISAVKFLLK